MRKKEKFYNLLVVFLLFIISFGIYFNSFKNSFIWDDLSLVLHNVIITNIKNVSYVFKSGLFPQISNKENFYRPIQSLSYMFDYSIWKLNPLGYHITNVIIHLLNSILIYFLVLRLSVKRNVALITSLFFLVHPIHTEAVSYISGRADPLALLFCLFSLLIYIRYSANEKQKIFYILSLICFFLALLSKEAAIIFPILIVLYDLSFSSRRQAFLSNFLRRYLGFLGVLFLYLLIYKLVVGEVAVRLVLLAKLSFFQKCMTSVYVITSYLGLLFIPLNLHMERVVLPVASIFDIRFFISVGIIGAISIALFEKIKKSRLAFFAAIWFIVCLIPISNIFLPLNALMAEHWLYFPSVGFFILLALSFVGISQVRPLREGAILFSIIVLIFYSLLTIKQNKVWKDPIIFYQYTLKFSPKRARLHSNLGNAYSEKGLYREAINEISKAIELDPNYAEAYTYLGDNYERMGRYDEAITEYRKSISLKPSLLSTHNNLGNVYTKKGQYDEAIAAYRSSLKINPRDYEIWSNLGNVYQKNKDFINAQQSYEEALKLNPRLVNVYINLGIIFFRDNKVDKAIETYKKALKLNRNSSEAYFNLGLAYIRQNRFDLAKKSWEEALRINPNLISAKEGIEKLKEAGY